MGFIFNFIKRLIKLIIKLTLYLAVFASIIVLIPNLPPYTKFTSIEQSPAQPRVGPLAPNNALNNAEPRYKGKLLGPEAFQIFNGELYTSLQTGEIMKISPGGHITFVTKVGQPCTGHNKEHICGRPLGFQIDEKHNTLYLTDAYYGIWKVDLKTDKKQLLVSPRVDIAKRTPKLFNSIVLDKNGDFYWTDSSSDFYLKDGAFVALSDPSGRVLHYSAAKNESKTLIDDLWLPNGLALSPNKEFLMIAESGRFRLLKHYVSGPNKGKTEVFTDGLPGSPDNVRVLPDGSGLLVALYTMYDDDHPLLMRSMSSTPLVRKFLARLQRLIEIPFEHLNTVYPHVLFEDIVDYIGHFRSIAGLLPPMSGLVQIDWNGNVIASYVNTDSSLGKISEAIVFNDKLYTGSPHQDYIGALPLPPLLKKSFETTEKAKAPKVEKPQQAKPVQPTKPKVEEKSKTEQIKPKEEVKPKVEQKPKLEQKPKVEEKPKVDQKPKAEEKPKVEQKAKVDEKPKVDQKPKIQTKAKVEEKKEAPKVANVDSKPRQQPDKPVPVQVKAPGQPPKTTTLPPKATTPSIKTEIPKTTPQPREQPKPTTPKPEAKTTPPPPKTTTKKPEQPKAQTKPQGKAKQQIPINEEIYADTAQPPKETLKVIKKGGVNTEIPARNL